MRQAVILVGGRETRPDAFAPNPLIPIRGDVRFLDYLVENIARHGFEEILLLADPLADKVVERYSGRSVRGGQLQVIPVPAQAGTAGALIHARERLDDVFLMSHGDSFLDMNYLALSGALEDNVIGALTLREVDDARHFGRVSLEGNRITAFHEKDASSTGPALVSGGVYALRRSILDRVSELPCSIETDIFPQLLAGGQLSGLKIDGFFIDIGLPEPLQEGRTGLPDRMRRPAVFFDRDGTLNVDHGYTHKVEDLVFLPGAIEAVRAVNDAGALAIVITNQAGLARGLYEAADVDRFHHAMQDQLRAHGAHIDAWYMCPFHEDGIVSDFRQTGHPDRKPAPGMIRRAMLDWPIRTMGSFVVGDRELDRAAAVNAGLPGFIVRPGELLGQVQSSLGPLNLSSSLSHSPQEGAVSEFEPIIARAAYARDWLFNHALPLWWHIGFDPRTQCFHERIGLDGSPALVPRRVRAQARQTFVYAMAGRLGWKGPWREAVEAGAQVLVSRGLRSDGGTVHTLNADGQILDGRRDLYDSAFVAFGLAHAGAALQRRDYLDKAFGLTDWLFENWSHPNGGFLEGDVVTVPPRRQNPHMHMLEALLALHEATGDALALKRAGAIVELFTTRFMSERWGALLEYFDEAWAPVAGDEGRISEPGHQFEWSWLLDRYRRLSGVDVSQAAHRLYVHGEAYGVSSDGYTVDEVWAEGVVRTPTSRLWPHTERIKANIIRVETLRDPRAAGHVVEAFDALMTYCDLPIPGLWRDRRLPDGSFLEEAAPASSFYHIILALSELIRVAEMLESGG